ncbi:MAG TPA: DUF2269 domain-containing protein [Magnetospirillaceae bacterium]
MDWYPILKTVHVVGVILFVGNITVTGMWKAMADRTRDPHIIAFAQRLVTLTDWVFTLGGIVLLAISGALTAQIGGYAMTAPWLIWGTALFALTGVIWIAVLVPAQMALGRMAREFAVSGAIPDRYWRIERRWMVFGIVATILPIATVAVMVFKAG